MSRIQPEPSVRLDVAVDRAMVEPASAATRAELAGLRAAIDSRDVLAEGIDPPSLVGEVFAYIIPRLSNPAVLRFERRRLVLERLEAAASARADGAPVVPGALLALRHELGHLRLLQQHRDSLIEA